MLAHRLVGIGRCGGRIPVEPGLPASSRSASGNSDSITRISKSFPGTVRDYWVYVPAQYAAENPSGYWIALLIARMRGHHDPHLLT